MTLEGTMQALESKASATKKKTKSRRGLPVAPKRKTTRC
jgi:hypothetical protein